MMKERAEKAFYILSTGFYGLLSVLFVFVLITSLGKNLIDMLVRIGWDWRQCNRHVANLGFIIDTALSIHNDELMNLGKEENSN